MNIDSRLNRLLPVLTAWEHAIVVHRAARIAEDARELK
jgi:hypothetical protein